MTLELPGFASAAQFEALVGQTLTSSADEAVDGPGIGHGDRRGPADRNRVIDAGGQHRSAADKGSAGQRRQLARPVAARAGQPVERRGSEHADRAKPVRFSAEHRRPAGDQQRASGAANPRVSQEAVGEFQFVASRWDASQGRSNGVLVNAVTKSGTNDSGGSFAASFRNSPFQRARLRPAAGAAVPEPAVQRHLWRPESKDRAHYFVYYERESEPSTITFNSPYPSFNVDQERETCWTGRRHAARFSDGRAAAPDDPRAPSGIRTDPAYAGLNGATLIRPHRATPPRMSDTLFATFSKVLGNRGLNEIKGGFTGAVERNKSVVDLGASSAGGGCRRHQRRAAHQLQRLPVRQQQHELAADTRTAGRVAARRFHVFVQQGRPP